MKDVEITMTIAFLSIQKIANKYGNVEGGWIVINQENKQAFLKELKEKLPTFPKKIRSEVKKVINMLEDKNVRQVKIKGDLLTSKLTINEKQII